MLAEWYEKNPNYKPLGNDCFAHVSAIIGCQPLRHPAFARKAEWFEPPVFGSAVLIGPGAEVFAGATIGGNTVICNGASVRENTRIGENCVIGRQATISHDCILGDNVRVMDQAHVTGKTTVGDGTFIAQHAVFANDKDPREYVWKDEFNGPTIGKKVLIGAGCYVGADIVIGDGAIIAALAIVTKNVQPGAIIKGKW